MSASIDDLAASLSSSWNPNETKSQEKPGTGRAVNNGLFTPELTPEVDVGRAEAQKKREADLAASEAAKTATEGQVADKAPQTQSAASNSANGDNEAAEQARILQQVLSCGQDEHHQILGLKDDFTDPELEIAAVEAAVYSRGIEVHPKLNHGKEAEKVWTWIQAAGRELGCRESVIQEVQDYVETDSDAASVHNAGPMEGVVAIIPQPDRIILALYAEATPSMGQLQQFPKSSVAKRSLNKINAQIKDKNKREDQEDEGRWCIDHETIAESYQAILPLVERIQKDGNDLLAETEAAEVAKGLHTYLQKNHYPEAWGLQKDLLMERAAKGTAGRGQQTTKGEGTGQQKPARSESGAVTDKEAASSSLPAQWKAGLTSKHEQIYGMQPYETTSKVTGEKVMSQCFFLVEKKDREKGKGSMVYEDVALVGLSEADSYFKLPESDKIDIRSEKYEHSFTDKSSFLEIDDIAVKPGYNSKTYPALHLRTRHQGETYKYPNRTTFRKTWGEAKADLIIEDFYIKKGIDIPWMKTAKRPEREKVADVVATVEATELARTIEGFRKSRSRYKSPERQRRRSVSSSTSTMSDASLERLAGIEERMSKFEKMFENLGSKIDALKR